LLATGKINPEYMKSMADMRMAMGSGEALKSFTAAKAARAASNTPKTQAALERATSYLGTAAQAEAKGLTSVPGFARHALNKGGLKDVYKLGLKPQWTQQGLMGKSMIALPAGFAGYEAITPSEKGGQGKGERVGRALGTGLGYATTPFIPFLGSEAIGSGIGAVTGRLGKGIDEMMGGGQKQQQQQYPNIGYNPASPQVEQSYSDPGVERHYTERALGRPPEDMMT